MSDNWIARAYEQQNHYNDMFAEWRTFDRDHAEYIKSTIGLMLFGMQEVENPPPTVSYYKVYSAKNRKIIDLIFKHIEKESNSRCEIYLSCTYLIGKMEKEEIFTFPVLRYCRSPSRQIYFAETTGRYYRNWNDFLSSNQLPPCVFLAPSDGLYTLSTPIFYEKYQSPAASSERKLLNTANKAATVASVACIGASLCTVAPITVMTAGLGLSVFGVTQSIATLKDRSKHGQSIALDNRECLLSYGNIVATAMTGASTAAMSNIGRLRGMFSNYSNTITTTCKVLNASTLVLDSSFMLLTTYDFYTKLKTGTLTYEDVFGLSLQLFLFTGSIVQTREMHRLLNQSKFSPPGVVNKKLTKTQKRNLQKRRAKARTRGEVSLPTSVSSEVSNNTLPVSENDLYSSLKMFSLRVGVYGVNLMMRMYPRSEVILIFFYDLRDLFTDTFIHKKMSFNEFFQQVFNYTKNLYIIIEKDISEMKDVLRRCIPNQAHIHNNELIAQKMNNEMDRLNQLAEEVMPTMEETQNDQTVHTDDNLILKYVCENCTKYKLNNGSPDAQISLFHNLLIFTLNYVDDYCVRLFNENFNTCRESVGEENAMKMVSPLGSKIGNDFYSTVAFFEKVLENCRWAEREFMKNFSGIEYEERICSPLAQEIFQQYAELMNLIYAQVTSGNSIGVRQMVYLQKDISSTLESKLGDDYRKISSDSRSLYEEYVESLGQAIAEEMMKRLEMPTTESGFFKSALNSLDVGDIVSALRSRNIIPSEELILPEVFPTQLKEKSHEEMIVKLVGDLFTIIEKRESERFANKSELFASVTTYVAEKFITDMKESARICEELKIHLDTVGPKLMKTMLENIGLHASEKTSLFKSRAEVLGSESNLKNMADEFLELHRSSRGCLNQTEYPKIFETTIGDDGFTAYKITCDQKASDESFRVLVFLLFKIKISASKSQIQRDKRCVAIKFENKVITFTFPAEENIALVILADLDCTNEQV